MDLKAFQELEEGNWEDANSGIHIHSCKAEVAAARTLQEGSIVQQLQQIGDQEKLKTRMAIKALICCTHFLTRRHILSIMTDECTDVTTIEELSIFCCFVEDGQPIEHFLEIVHLKATDAITIYSAHFKFMKDKNIQISKLVDMGFDGVATFF